VNANLRTLIEKERELSMKRDLMPATTLTTLKKIALTLLCCTVLMVFGASAQTVQQIKADPGNNNPPPAGPLLDLSGTPIPGSGNGTYQLYTVNFTAGVENTAITFAFRDDPAFISFAGASVTDTAIPGSSNLLFNGDFSLGPTGSNTPTGWTYANVYGATFGGTVQPSTNTPGEGFICNFNSTPYSNYWCDGAVQAYDAISQSIVTTVGHIYQISFFVAENSHCSTNVGVACNFSDLSTNGVAEVGGNGINLTVYAQGGLPVATVTQQGPPIDPTNPESLKHEFVLPTTGGQVAYGYDFSAVGTLTFPNGTPTPFVGFSGVTQSQYQSLVAGTALEGTSCLTAAGLRDASNNPLCALISLTATTATKPTASGANLPQSTCETDQADNIVCARNILLTHTVDLDINQNGVTGGILTIPTGTAPGLAEFNDVGSCPFPDGDPLSKHPCPGSIMTSIQDGPTKPGGTPKPAGSATVLNCCRPEWKTQPTINLWNNNLANVPVKFDNQKPALPALQAQALGVLYGAANVPVETTIPDYPGERIALATSACPASSLWTAQNPVDFSVTGSLSEFDNGTTTASPLVEGSYNLLYAVVTCDEFINLKYPATIDFNGDGSVGPNEAKWNTQPFNVDTTYPTVGPITFSATGPFLINQVVTASVTCTDPSSPNISNFFSGIAECGSQSSFQTFPGNQKTQIANNVPVPTNIAGANQFTAFAQDVAGNQVMQQVPYTVAFPSADTDLIQIGPLFVKSGSNATYNMAVWNEGPGPAYNVVVSDVVPNSETVLSANYALVTCTIFGCPPPPSGSPSCTFSPNTPGNGATCTIVGGIPVIPKGARSFRGISVKLVAKVSASAGSVVKTTATVNASNPNPDKNTSFPWFTLVTR
jgi:uncharacterized repeat protein (TIGR01451 family)